jgi:hypothetical protein
MRDISVQIGQETSRVVRRQDCGLFEASKPYALVFLIVTILLSVWAGLCAT